MSALWKDILEVEARYYVRIMARLPPAEPAAAWMRESVDIVGRAWSIEVRSKKLVYGRSVSGYCTGYKANNHMFALLY